LSSLQQDLKKMTDSVEQAALARATLLRAQENMQVSVKKLQVCFFLSSFFLFSPLFFSPLFFKEGGYAAHGAGEYESFCQEVAD